MVAGAGFMSSDNTNCTISYKDNVIKIDADTVIISGSALICSPPFVPVVAAALKNKEIILTGMIVGVAGYAIGNYLGIFIAYLLK